VLYDTIDTLALDIDFVSFLEIWQFVL